MKVNILGVNIDSVDLAQALALSKEWIAGPDKHYIVTPNLEFILAAQADPEFKRILNNADLAIPDSSSLGFSSWLLKKNILIRLFLWPLFFLPLKQLMHFERVSGTDLVEAICKLSAEKGFITGFLGGGEGVAEKCAERLQKKYPGLKVVFASDGGKIDDGGMGDLKSVPPVDILFVAFGHIKQEKWIANNLEKIPVKLAIGVGGALDYLSGDVPRAPLWFRSLGF
ncbi:WecB/TagA/CpsF family glycosyltransferase, partial [Patescibacteria group bacterium]|nr:WecB/TagA/CpsF family glycosyltransferase [Patescibacteria group bacterium]